MVTKQYDRNGELFFVYGDYTVYLEQREVIETNTEKFITYIPSEIFSRKQVPITWQKVVNFETTLVEVQTNQVESRSFDGTSTGTNRFGDSYTKRDFTPKSVYKKVSVNYTYPIYTFTNNLGEVTVRNWLKENFDRISKELFSFPKDVIISEEEFTIKNLPSFKEVYLTEDEKIALCIEWLDTHLESLLSKLVSKKEELKNELKELKPTELPELREESIKKKVILPSKKINKPTKPIKRKNN